MRVIFTCGGTGGHINPAIAVAQRLKKRIRDLEMLFIGAQGGMEEKLIPLAGFELKVLRSRNLRHKLSPGAMVHNVKTVAMMLTAVNEAKKILEDFSPDVVVGTGGYACFPAVRAAKDLKIPSCIHESNAVPGVTTKLLAKKADRVLVNFPGVESFYPKPERVAVVGMPVRNEFLLADRKESREKLGLDGRPVLLSFFGSLGARDMNYKMAHVIKSFAESGEFQLVHVMGKRGAEWMPGYLLETGVVVEGLDNIRLMEYAYNMPEILAACDLVVCRGGSSTLSELSVAGRPALLIPSPNVTNNHQEKNALKLAETGGVLVKREEELTPEALEELVRTLLGDRGKLGDMSEALRRNAIFDADDRICDIVEELAGG